jgi:DNA-binding beta-propeller fold protein YncE
VQVRLQSSDTLSDPLSFNVAKKLASDLHPVSNPAFDPDDGSLFVTRSGSRGEELPVTLFRIDVEGDVIEFSGDIVNPTGIAFSRDGEMFVTSRLDGVVYKVNPFKEVVRNLGVATGIAFDEGVMHGRPRRVNLPGQWYRGREVVGGRAVGVGYHLAFGPDDSLYVMVQR